MNQKSNVEIEQVSNGYIVTTIENGQEITKVFHYIYELSDFLRTHFEAEVTIATIATITN